MEWIWLILVLVFLVIEAITFNLITIWFALGSLAAFISAYFVDNTSIQIIVFVIVTTLSLIMTRGMIKKLISQKPIRTNLDVVIGKTGIVTKEIRTHEIGRVKIAGKTWAAISKKDIDEGAEVEILDIEGVKLIVKKKGDE